MHKFHEIAFIFKEWWLLNQNQLGWLGWSNILLRLLYNISNKEKVGGQERYKNKPLPLKEDCMNNKGLGVVSCRIEKLLNYCHKSCAGFRSTIDLYVKSLRPHRRMTQTREHSTCASMPHHLRTVGTWASTGNWILLKIYNINTDVTITCKWVCEKDVTTGWNKNQDYLDSTIRALLPHSEGSRFLRD